MRASALFPGGANGRGLDLDDWLEAEREISLAEDEVVLSESDERIDLSISAVRAEPRHIILSLSLESVLVLWTRSESGAADQDAQIPNPGLSLLLLPRSVDPEKPRSSTTTGRVWLQLPYAENDSDRRSLE